MALSAVIVVTYAGVRIAARPPEVADHTPASNDGDSTAGATGSPAASVDPGPQRKEQTYTFLLVASDQVSGNTDTMMVLTYDTVNQTAGLVSLPRDTMIDGVKDSDGSHFYKLNGTYAYNGIEGLKKEVSQILGIPIDFYVKVNTRGFVKLVDAIGGVDFNVPVNMNYEDPTQDLYIHFNKGMQWLSGSDALKVARCRQNSYYDEAVGKWKTYDAYSNADIGRTETQRSLLTAVLKKALSQPQKLPTYYDIFLENVQTDLSANDLLYFAEKALYFDFSSGLTTSVLPGDGTVTYHGWTYCYELYPDQLLELINTQGINPYTTDITADMLTLAQKS
ncbi:LCP family protein [Pseudoflavonifractor phocaeensis]|nr:LCP family protein [Pseudoflavonifractor phocaeensis]